MSENLKLTGKEPTVAEEKLNKENGRPSGPAPAKSPTKFPVGTVLVCVLLVLGGWWLWRRNHSTAAQGSAAARAAAGPVPVVAGSVVKKDVPIYVDGLGTVQAFNTVTIRPRVDGQLRKIAFKEGQDVKAGDLLAEIDPDPFIAQLQQNEAKKGEDDAQLENARIQLQRDTRLTAQKIISQQDFDTQKALVDQYEAAVKADQAAIKTAQVQLAYTSIRAPIDGRVGLRLVDEGNVVHAGDSNGLVIITQLRPISVIFTLPEQALGEIQKHANVGELTVLAVDRDNTTVLGEGKLAVVDNQIDTGTGTLKLKATFANEDLRLWPGQFVNTRLLATVRRDSVVVPTQTVQRGPEGPFVFVIKEDSTVQIRPVKLGPVERGEVVVTEGLKPGESIVVDGQYKLQPGSHVKTGEDTKSPAGKPDPDKQKR